MKTFLESIINLFKRMFLVFVTEKVFLVVSFFVLILLAIGTIFYTVVEKLSFLDSAYYSTMVITTVGADGFQPKTALGKIFTILYSFLSTALFVGLTASLAQTIILSEHRKERTNLYKYRRDEGSEEKS